MRLNQELLFGYIRSLYVSFSFVVTDTNGPAYTLCLVPKEDMILLTSNLGNAYIVFGFEIYSLERGVSELFCIDFFFSIVPLVLFKFHETRYGSLDR